MFKTDRTVYKYKEGIYDLMDEKSMNVVSGYIPFRNKKERMNAWRQIKQEFAEYGDNLKIIIQDGILSYSINVPRTHI
jgi:hypothetical protein